MRAFIPLQKRFPQASVFEQTKVGSFNKERGFRWAAPSFGFRHRNPEEADISPSPLVPVDESRIHVQYPGVSLNWSDLTFNDDRELFFLLPKQWDYYYTVHWVEKKLDISQTLSGPHTGSTFPALVLKSNIVIDDDRESRARFKTFKLDSINDDMGDEDEEEVTGDHEDFHAMYSSALLVAVASDTTIIASIPGQAELQATIVCSLLVSKDMFSTYKCAATR